MDAECSWKTVSKRNFVRNSRPTGARRYATPQQQQLVCRYWQEGRCTKGDDCRWLHLDGAGTTGRPRSSTGAVSKRPNSYVNESRSGFSEDGAGFSSGGAGAKKTVNFARKVRTRKNNDNNDSVVNNTSTRRSGENAAKRAVCKFWLSGGCQNGGDCKFLHAHSASPDVSLIKQLKGHEKAVRAIELALDSTKLYTGGQDETVRVWDCNTGECTNVVQMGGDVGALLSAENCLAVGLPNEIKICHLQTNAMQSLSSEGHGQVHALAVGGDTLFAGTHDGSVLVWKFSTNSNSLKPAVSLLGHSGPVTTLLIHGDRLYSGSGDCSIKVWDLGPGECIQTLEGHTDVVMQLLFWGKFLLSCSLDGTVRVWGPGLGGVYGAKYTHLEDSRQSKSRKGALSMCGTTDSSGKSVLVCSFNDNTLQFYDLPTFSERGTIRTREEVRVMQSGPGGLVFSGERYGEMKVWRIATAATAIL